MAEIDVDRSGEIDFDEFHRWYVEKRHTPSGGGSGMGGGGGGEEMKAALTKSRSAAAWDG